MRKPNTQRFRSLLKSLLIKASTASYCHILEVLFCDMLRTRGKWCYQVEHRRRPPPPCSDGIGGGRKSSNRGSCFFKASVLDLFALLQFLLCMSRIPPSSAKSRFGMKALGGHISSASDYLVLQIPASVRPLCQAAPGTQNRNLSRKKIFCA